MTEGHNAQALPEASLLPSRSRQKPDIIRRMRRVSQDMPHPDADLIKEAKSFLNWWEDGAKNAAEINEAYRAVLREHPLPDYIIQQEELLTEEFAPNQVMPFDVLLAVRGHLIGFRPYEADREQIRQWSEDFASYRKTLAGAVEAAGIPKMLERQQCARFVQIGILKELSARPAKTSLGIALKLRALNYHFGWAQPKGGANGRHDIPRPYWELLETTLRDAERLGMEGVQ
jgi:hypothetical protein